MERARTVLEKALSLSPTLARANYFYARVLRSEGNIMTLPPACTLFSASIARPRALNDLARILFLQRKYTEAVKTLQSVLTIDPEICKRITI